ncbi:hypothetical protein D3C78_1292730 [compost metagenome]
MRASPPACNRPPSLVSARLSIFSFCLPTRVPWLLSSWAVNRSVVPAPTSIPWLLSSAPLWIVNVPWLRMPPVSPLRRLLNAAPWVSIFILPADCSRPASLFNTPLLRPRSPLAAITPCWLFSAPLPSASESAPPTTCPA